MRSNLPGRLAGGLVAGVLVVAATATPSRAQLRASETATVSQVIDGTEISLRYDRPRARGRTGLFGSTVHWGETWTPGANQATTLGFTRDVVLDGVSVPAGKYSVWMVVERGPWELVLDPDTTLFHTQRPRAREGQIRLPIAREKRPFTEVLTWSFPRLRSDGATLVMQWDTVAVPLEIRVQPSYERAVAADEAARIAGRYRIEWVPPPDMPQDTTVDTESEGFPSSTLLTVRHEEGELRATMDPPLFTSEPGYAEWLLVPVRDGWYNLGRFQNGELVEIMAELAIEFTPREGRATGFEARLPNDALVASATRVEGDR